VLLEDLAAAELVRIHDDALSAPRDQRLLSRVIAGLRE
jgi:hypothetical protein